MTFISNRTRRIDQAGLGSAENASHRPVSDRPAQAMELRHLDYFQNNYEADMRIFWSMIQLRHGNARMTVPFLHDVLAIQGMVAQLRTEQITLGRDPVQYVVFGSDIPGIYSLGGDLALFADRIRMRDRDALAAYAHLCIDVVYTNHVAFDLPIVTIGLVQGDALGGGFEGALSYDVLVAERSAKLGLPEVLFNLFPGMGAYSFLSRKLGSAGAEAMIMSGRIYTGAELHAMGVVDVLAEDGEGEDAVRDYVARNNRKFNTQQALLRTRRRVAPITDAELRDVVEIWVDAAMRLGEADLRKMDRLMSAQRRRLAAMEPAHAVAAE